MVHIFTHCLFQLACCFRPDGFFSARSRCAKFAIIYFEILNTIFSNTATMSNTWVIGPISTPQLAWGSSSNNRAANRRCPICGIVLLTGEKAGFCCGLNGNHYSAIQPLPPLPDEFNIFLNSQTSQGYLKNSTSSFPSLRWNQHMPFLPPETQALLLLLDGYITMFVWTHKAILQSGGCSMMDSMMHLSPIIHKHERFHPHGSAWCGHPSHIAIPSSRLSSPYKPFGFNNRSSSVQPPSLYRTLAVLRLLQ